MASCFHGLETAAVVRGPAAQRGLGIDAARPGDHDGAGEELREIGFEVVAPGAQACHRGVDPGQGLVATAGIEPDRGRLAEQLVGVEQRRAGRA